MKMKGIWIAGLCLAAIAGAQNAPKLAHREVVGDAESLTTHGEMVYNVNRLEKVLRKVSGLPAMTKPLKSANPNAPMKRSDLVIQFDRLLELQKPRFKMSPRMRALDGPSIAYPTGHAVRLPAEKLLKWGFVPRASTLVTGKKDGVSLREFGESLAYFASRSAELLNLPDSKFTPFLMPGGG